MSKVLAFAFGLSAEIERNLISKCAVEELTGKKKEGKRLGEPKASLAKVAKLTGRENEIKLLLEKGGSAIIKIFGVIGRPFAISVELWGALAEPSLALSP